MLLVVKANNPNLHLLLRTAPLTLLFVDKNNRTYLFAHRQHTTYKVFFVLQSVCSLNATPTMLSLASTEGSLSDSGISDSGSEHESERERRLTTLRRLGRQLEAVLAPNSEAIRDMTTVSAF